MFREQTDLFSCHLDGLYSRGFGRKLNVLVARSAYVESPIDFCFRSKGSWLPENGAETWPFTRINTTHAQPAMMTTLSVLIQNCRAIRGRPRLESNQWMPDARGYVRSRGSDQLPPLPSVYKSTPTGRKTGFLGQLLLPLTRSDVLAVTRVVEAVFAEPDEEEKKGIATPLKGISDGGIVKEWEPFGEPKLFSLARSNVSYRFNGRDGQI